MTTREALRELVHVRMYDVDELDGARIAILRSIGRTYDELLAAERDYALTPEEDAALNELRNLEFLRG